jgi:hypothetical protein
MSLKPIVLTIIILILAAVIDNMTRPTSRIETVSIRE